MRIARASISGLVVLLAATSCGRNGAQGSASASASALAASRPPTALPPSTPATPVGTASPGAANPNPLRLPSTRLTLDAGRRVFTVPEQMLATARPGSTLMLHAATVSGMEGDDLIVETPRGPTYKVHAAYAIAVPDEPKVKPGDPVITEHNGVLKHGVVTKFIRDRVGVRYTDLEGRSQEALLVAGSGKPTAAGPSKAARMIKQVEGFAPGNYAALRRDEEHLHVLLVSAHAEGDARRWLALGFGGSAMIVAEADLAPIPVRWSAKAGKVVWAASGGKMRRATVQTVDDQGLLTVKFERAGRASTVGWGLVMAPLDS